MYSKAKLSKNIQILFSHSDLNPGTASFKDSSKLKNKNKKKTRNTCMHARTHTQPHFGVPVVAQWLTNPTRNHEVEGSIPGLAQWVNDPVLP